MTLRTILSLGLALTAFPSFAALSENVSVSLEPVYENLKFKHPVQITHPNDEDTRRFLVLQEGKILILPEDPTSSEVTTYLDLSERNLIGHTFEEGLLGLAFHPDFASNRKFYLYHSQQNPKRTILSEWKQSAEDPNKADLSSERILMEIPQPFWNHNSGCPVFGPDGMLYLSVGDGGRADDPHHFAQNMFSVLGKVLRIDVNTRSGDLPYGIPEDNPFANTEGMRPEIWAYGLRNPWIISFDRKTSHLWCADVGQTRFEEINHIVKGGNYGWVFKEGFHDHNPKNFPIPENAKLIDPIHEYPRTDGISITGGFVYYGSRFPELDGHYLYGDWGSGTIWALHFGESTVTSNKTIFKRDGKHAGVAFQPTYFYQTASEEILVASRATNLPGKGRGGIYRLIIAD